MLVGYNVKVMLAVSYSYFLNRQEEGFTLQNGLQTFCYPLTSYYLLIERGLGRLGGRVNKVLVSTRGQLVGPYGVPGGQEVGDFFIRDNFC